MADSVSQIPTNVSDKSNCMNVIQKTTTETIRLGESDKLSVQSAAASANVQGQKKKTSSFQITSVTIVNRQSNDGGEDSADDLDESHTEDTSDVIDSSKVTDFDNETPSYSEDTFSKCEDVFINPMPAGLSAPVIPTSSQYGLALVPGSGRNNQNADTNVSSEVNVTENLISIPVMHVKTGEREFEQWQNRFKVVKIESTEPFKRGRWLCLDFLDHTSVQSQATVVKEDAGSGNSSAASSVHMPGETPLSENQLTHGTEELDMNALTDSNTVSKSANTSVHDPASTGLVQPQVHPAAQPVLQAQTSYTGVSQSQTEFPASLASHTSGIKQSQPSSLGPQIVSQQPQVPVPEYSIAAGQSVGLPSNLPSTSQGQSIGQSLVSQKPTVSSQTQAIPTQNLPQPPNPVPQQPSQATETIINTNIAPTQLQQEFANVPKQHTQGVTVIPHISQSSVQGTNIPTTVQSSIPAAAQPSTGTSSMVSSVGIQSQPSSFVQQSPQSNISIQTGASNSPQLSQGQATSAIHVSQGPLVSASSGQNIAPSITQSQPTATQPHTPLSQHPSGHDPSFAQTRQQPVNPQSSLDVGGHAVEVSMEAPHQLLNSLQEKMSTSGDVTIGGEDSESTSGTSTVAIDNKIEQAMDLVKSHLMFAVREEVEVLKEKISELMDRIQQLEYENTILKSHATQETLAQLSQPPPKSQPPGGPPSSTS